MFQLSLLLLALLSVFCSPAAPPVPERWRAWPVTRVFPYAVPGTSPSGAQVTYLLAGVAPEASCAAAFQPALPACVTALRATYADSTATYVATAGIAVLARPVPPGAAGPLRVPAVRPVAFPGGPAERFGERQCFTGTLIASHAPYVIATTAGYADGRSFRPGDQAVPRLGGFARQLATELHRGLTG
ncbi:MULTISPECIES: hypothetical protein [Nonomuraea]|uniref:Uncharacterized protein n=2 Tax=Nonomuraea TaxID=83681 RepID=A0ABW1BYA2_9ACTN|nr:MULTISPECIES: hypothetical protein [Nonomuraea]MDA0646963.1 hypothetical protein [Nonomuraea ferruginea]